MKTVTLSQAEWDKLFLCTRFADSFLLQNGVVDQSIDDVRMKIHVALALQSVPLPFEGESHGQDWIAA